MKNFKTLTNMYIKIKACTLFVFYGLLLLPSVMSGQTAKIEDILTIRLSDSGPLKSGQDVKGYYFVYETESSNKDQNTYDLRIHDLNLNLLKKKKISVPKTYALETVLYNGRSIAVKFFDAKELHYVFKGYTLEGELIFTKETSKISKYENYKNSTSSDEFPSFYSIPQFGYMNYTMTKDKGEKLGYNINFYSDNASVPHWTFNSTSDKFETANHLAADSTLAYFSIMKRDGAMSTDVSIFLIAFSSKTGKMAFEIPLVGKEYKYLAFSSFISASGNLHLMGRYYGLTDNVLKDKGLGVSLLEIDRTGIIVNATHIPADDKRLISSSASSGEDKADKSTYFYFHDFINLEDGRVIGIAESYSLKVNVLGLAGNLYGLGTSGGNIVIEDMYIFEFDKEFELQNIKRFDKYKSNFALPGIPIASPVLYSYYVKERGGFDYQFYQKNSDNTVAGIYFLNYERRKDAANNMVLGAIFASKDGYTTDKFDLSKKADDTNIFQGAFGSVVIMDYYRKLKSLNVQIVKLNF